MRSCCRGWKRVFVDAVGPRARRKRPCVVPSSCSKTSRSTPQKWTSRSGTTRWPMSSPRKTMSPLQWDGLRQALAPVVVLDMASLKARRLVQLDMVLGRLRVGRLGTDGPSFELPRQPCGRMHVFESGGGKLVLHVVLTPSQTESCRISSLNAQPRHPGGIMAGSAS